MFWNYLHDLLRLDPHIYNILEVGKAFQYSLVWVLLEG
jgi:hypothetical protein